MLSMGGAEQTLPTQASVTMSGSPPSTPATLTMTSGTGRSTFDGLRWIFIALLLARTCGRYPTSRAPANGRLRRAFGLAQARCRSGMIPPMGESPPFAGIASFLKAPYMADPRSDDAEVAILGIPYDEATTARPGARYGPRAMRDASTNWAYREAATPFYDGEADTELLGGVRFVDSGDVDLPPSSSVSASPS